LDSAEGTGRHARYASARTHGLRALGRDPAETPRPFASRHGDQAGRVEGRGHAQAVRYRAFREDDAVALTPRVIDGPDLRPADRWILRRPQIHDRPAR